VSATNREKRARAWPGDPSGLRHVGDLGGSTGADLMEGADGELFVVKRGADPGHVREETLADEAYRALGVSVPDGGLRHDGGRVAKVSAYIEGVSLQQLLLAGRREAEHVASELRGGFAADALLANWDVVGEDFTNPILGEDGTVYRVDNGSALRRRARGGTKPADAFSGEVRELCTMRERLVNPAAAYVFSALTDGEIARQILGYVFPNRDAVLSVLPAGLRRTVGARIDHMEAWAAWARGGDDLEG